MADHNEDWQFYVIPDLITWANPREYGKSTEIEHYNSFDEAKERFEELLSEAYNSETVLDDYGQPAARLTLGVEKSAAAFDILHVRGGENVLVEDFTRDADFAADSSLLAAIRKTAVEIGFDKVNSYPILENGKRGMPALVPFDKWAAEHPQYNLSGEVAKIAPFYDKPIEYARENGEISEWRESMRETERCAGAIAKLVADNHDGFHLATEKIIEDAVREFGTERVTTALASTIQNKDWDGRFSQKNREWANSITVTKDTLERININAHSALLDGVVNDYREFLITLEKNLAEKQGLSNNNAVRSAENIQGGITTMADHNTTFEVSSMLKIDDGGKTKALANIVINGEIAVNNVKVMEGKNGLNIVMPSKLVGNEYVDTAHTTTTEAYAQLKDAVMTNFDKLIASGENTLKNDLGFDKNKPAVSEIKATLHPVEHETVKASGSVKIDDCFVINDVKVIKPKDADKPEFVSMPSYANAKGGYTEVALPITTAMHDKIDNVVIEGAYKHLEKVEYKGVKYNELGDKNAGEITGTSKLNNKFAETLMQELDKAGVTYQARVGSKSGTVISVNIADKPKLDEIQKSLVKALNPEKEDKRQSAPAQENKPPKRGRH